MLEEYSEKEMIGSLLEDESETPQGIVPVLSVSGASNTYLQKQEISHRMKSLGSSKTQDLMNETSQGTDDQSRKHQNGNDRILFDFPTVTSNQYFFHNSEIPIVQTLRQHSLSSEDQYFQQFNNCMIPNIKCSTPDWPSNSYTPQIIQPRTKFYHEGYFSQKRSRKIQYQVDLASEDLINQCQDQQASLVVQNQFEQGTEIQREIIFKAVENQLFLLSKHKFGNYVIQKMVEKGTQQMRGKIFENLQNNLLELSFDKFGCRVVQRLLEFIINKPHYQKILIQSIKLKLLALIFDQCGNHVVQKIMDQIPVTETEFIIGIVEQHADRIVSHSYGCRIAQKCLETYTLDKLATLYTILTPMIPRLSFCSYGNYIVQHMISNGPQSCFITIREFIHNFPLEVCQDKFASNVAQKYIQKTTHLDELGEKLFNYSLNQNIPIIILLINDQYGNYVIQQYYAICSEKFKQAIFQLVFDCPENLFTQYGRHFLRFLQG